LLCIAKGQSYHVEVACGEGEDVEGVFKRFRNTCNLSGMVYEARRRQYFENTQDIKKRKQQEKGLRKMRDQREKFLITYEEANTDTPPFTDLFQGEDDLYDITGSMSIDEELDDMLDRPAFEQRRRERGPTDLNAEPRSAAEASEQAQAATQRAAPPAQAKQNGTIRRSVASQSPAAVRVAEEKSKPKPKQQVDTARTRKAAAKQVATSPVGLAAQGRQAPTGSGVGSKARRKGGKNNKKSGGKAKTPA
jgi:ribosomal protein S21